MKLITLILLSLFITACGPGNNSKSRGNDGVNRGTPRTPTSQPAQGETNFASILHSQAFRTRNSDQLSYLAIRNLAKAGNLPTWIHFIPNPAQDTTNSVTVALPHDIECGIGEFATIDERVADCKTKNPASHLWDGKVNGISGEGNWILVANQANKQIWMDLTTELIWSDQLSDTGGWAQASGAQGMQDNALCLADRDDQALGHIPAEQIIWRLPTRSDFLQADINGSRFVLPNLGAQYWTAAHDGSASAWSIFQDKGILELVSTTKELAVRCVGIITK